MKTNKARCHDHRTILGDNGHVENGLMRMKSTLFGVNTKVAQSSQWDVGLATSSVNRYLKDMTLQVNNTKQQHSRIVQNLNWNGNFARFC